MTDLYLDSKEDLDKLRDFEIWKKWKNNEIDLIDLEFEENHLTE
jgi:hypothetical protein